MNSSLDYLQICIRDSTDPLEIIKRDKKKMKSEKKKWDKKLELVENQLAKLKDVLKKIDDALRFYYNEATDEIKEQLKDPLNWKNHTQLDLSLIHI